jgi:acetyl esterase/lipase
MDVQISPMPVQSSLGVTIPNTLMYREPRSPKLMVMLPGRGYSCEHPVMYFVRAMALTQGYEVLSLQYGFQVAQRELSRDEVPIIRQEIHQAMQQLQERNYHHFCVVGKSLGTPLAVELATSLAPEPVSLILLTPVNNAAQTVGGIRTLGVIGTADPFYDAEGMNQTPSNVQWLVFNGLDHALEHQNDWHASMAALLEIISACQTFIAG